MKSIVISKSEAKILKRDLKFPWHILIALIIVIIFAVIYYYLAINYESDAINTFSSIECQEIQPHINKMFRKLTINTICPALFFFSITVGLLIGSFINHIKRARFLEKINIEEFTSMNAEQLH